MWTEAHRARHEPRLKELVSVRAVEEIAAWLERADPPRSGRATPTRRVVGAIAWHLGPDPTALSPAATSRGARGVMHRLEMCRAGTRSAELPITMEH